MMSVRRMSVNGQHGLVHPHSDSHLGLFRRAVFGDRLASFVAQAADGTLLAGRFGPAGFYVVKLEGEAKKAAYRTLARNDAVAPDPDRLINLPNAVADELPPVPR